MIRLEFGTAVALIIICPISLVFLVWIFYTLKEEKGATDLNAYRQCPYCAYSYFNYMVEKEIEECPRCQCKFERAQGYGK